MSETDKLLADREKTHGDFSDVAQVYDKLRRVVASSRNAERFSPTQRYVLANILNKLARICEGDPDFVDHWQDVAGYAIKEAASLLKPPADPNAPKPLTPTLSPQAGRGGARRR